MGLDGMRNFVLEELLYEVILAKQECGHLRKNWIDLDFISIKHFMRIKSLPDFTNLKCLPLERVYLIT